MIVIDMGVWGWPQWTIIGLMTFSLFVTGFNHGKPKYNYDIGVAVLDFAISAALLAFGGFFS